MSVKNDKMWSRFDEICVLSCTKYADRLRTLGTRLNSVGIVDFKIRMNFRNPFDDVLFSVLKRSKEIKNASVMSCLMGTYAIIKTAFETGVENLLMLEDDVAFAKDRGMIAEAIETIPEDCDVAKLEWFFGKAERGKIFTDELFARPKAGGHWIDLDKHIVVGAGATAYNRNGMSFAIGFVERALSDGILNPLDMWMRPKHKPVSVRLYGSHPLVAVQSPAVGETMNEACKEYDPRQIHCGGYNCQ